MRQYDRIWKFTINPFTKNSDGTYTFNSSREFSNLRIVFDIRNTLLGDYSLATFQMYNISSATREMLSTGACYVTMEIGYKRGDLVPIFRGEVKNTYELRQQSDSVQHIIARDSNNMLSNFVPKVSSFKTAQKPKFILEEIIKASPNITGIKYAGSSEAIIESAESLEGYTVTEFLKVELDELLAPLQLGWHVDDRVLRVYSLTDDTKQLAGDSTPFKVSLDTGMITRPKVTWVKVTFDHLMNAKFKCDNLIELDPLTVERFFGNKFYVKQDEDRVQLDGIYRVMQAQHKGDTRGINWKTSVIAFNKTGA